MVRLESEEVPQLDGGESSQEAGPGMQQEEGGEEQELAPETRADRGRCTGRTRGNAGLGHCIVLHCWRGAA